MCTYYFVINKNRAKKDVKRTSYDTSCQILVPKAAISAELIDMYMTMPIISLVIDMNGPVARAGSILNRSSVSGTNVPNIEANTTTAKSDSDTATVVTCVGPREALGGSYEEVVKSFISDRQRAKLRKVINFEFRPHPRYNLPKERLKAIERFLQQRVRQLLAIEK